MKVDVLLGLQWGDEGKGKIVDVLTPSYELIARFQGGPNAGHTLMFEGEKYVLRSIPSGIFQGNKMNLIGNGVVLDPAAFKEELETLEKSGHKITDRLLISKKTHLILPTHRLLDSILESAKGDAKIGTTGRGIGPCYTDKIARTGLRVGDLDNGFKEKYNQVKARHLNKLSHYTGNTKDLFKLESEWFDAIDTLRQFKFVDSEHYINEAIKSKKKILAEGAQGTMLDIDFGSYPFVTSSNTVSAGACTGLGVAPNRIGEVYGIFKAYCTRVGSGPFPTELFDETGDTIREDGFEFGSVTGRPRRCGWVDLVALRYAIMLNGVSQLIMTKSDVLDKFENIRACVAYEVDGKETRDLPFDIEADKLKPVYKEIKGWQTDMTKIRSEAGFPKEFKDYMKFLEAELGVKITIVSLGPDREQTVFRTRRAFN